MKIYMIICPNLTTDGMLDTFQFRMMLMNDNLSFTAVAVVISQSLMKGGFLQFLLVSSTSARLRLEAALSSRCRASHSPHQADTRARDLVCSRTVVLEMVSGRELSRSFI